MSEVRLGNVALADIEFGDRFRQDYKNLPALVESFKKEGVIQPLAVKDIGEGKYLLAAGGRRHKAAELAGLLTVPVRIYPKDITDLQMREIELMENVCREEMDWLEAAQLKKAIHMLQIEMYGEKVSTAPDAPGASKRNTAELLNISPAKLTQDIKLADAAELFPDIKKAKNASDASKMLGKLQENVVRAELARRIEEKSATTPIERVRVELVNRFIVADFFDGIKQVPNNSIDFLEVDPPYAIDLKHSKRSMQETYTQTYNEIDQEQYIAFLTKVLQECQRVMAANSWLVLWHGRKWASAIFTILENSCPDLKANYESFGIWYKGNVGQTNHPELYLASCYEQFMYISKGTPNIVRQGRSNVYNYKPVPTAKKLHPTERPVELIQDVIQTFCWEGARIAVPFLGSGNTILSAANLGMTAFGWDLSKENKDGYTIRVNDSRPGSYQSYKKMDIE